jgi:hypothetical protein
LCTSSSSAAAAKFMQIPLVQNTSPIHVDKMAMDFGRQNYFHIQNQIAEHTSGEIS